MPSPNSSCKSAAPEVTWIGNAFQTGLTPRQYLRFNRGLRILPDNSPIPIDPCLRTPNNLEAGEPVGVTVPLRSHSVISKEFLFRLGNLRNLNPSPRAQQKEERLAQYQRKQRTKREIRGIIKTIQSKRRAEFCVLREALGEIHCEN
ncbi:hypothetical protein DFH28DRAFT_940650 [Melampsora americana]|nr:hypothetical protein DFH28DRAFT_940650 [Melampsora americana]